jgi:hypothetical protein
MSKIKLKDLPPLEPPSLGFLEELRERARRYGWNGDYEEVADFVEYLYDEAGFHIQQYELEPYDYEE